MKILPMAKYNYDTPGLSVVIHRVFPTHKIILFYLLYLMLSSSLGSSVTRNKISALIKPSPITEDK